MERRLIRQGENALTATLPAAWIRRKGLSAGDVVSIDEAEGDLIIRQAGAPKRREIEVDTRGTRRSQAFQKVLGAYIQGYDIIRVIHDAPNHMDDIASELIGMIIERQSITSTTFNSLIRMPEENLHDIMQRIRHMLGSQADMLWAASTDTSEYRRFVKNEKRMDTHIHYCLRYIMKYEQGRSAFRSLMQCHVLDLAGDMLTEIAKHMGDDEALANLVRDSVRQFLKDAAKRDVQSLDTHLRSFRSKVPKGTFAHGLVYALAETLYDFAGVIYG